MCVDVLRCAILGLSAIVLTAAFAGADDTAAYDTVRAAPRFAAGPVGYAGATSREEVALHELLSQPTASRDLRRLLSEATIAGRLYALWGLAVVEDADFPKLSEKYSATDTDVDTMKGCLVERETVSSIVNRIRAGQYGRPTN